MKLAIVGYGHADKVQIQQMVKLLLGKTPTQLKLAQHNPAREFTLPLAKIKSIHKVLSLRELLGT